METKELILSIYNVSEYLYCQKSCFYKIFGFEENQEHNLGMIEGRNQHEIVHSDSTRYKEKDIKQLTNLNVFSHKYNVRGKLDLLEIRKDKYIPIEYKKGKRSDYLNHKVQLCLQALCLEEMYNTKIQKAYLYFIQERIRVPVTIDDELRKITINTINQIKEKIKGNNPNLFIKNRNDLCPECSFFQTCLPFLTDK
jgi:CRISPR-associated exonuclease Cas4